MDAPPDGAAVQRWQSFLKPHYEKWSLDIDTVPETRLRLPFDEEMCVVVEEIKPEVVSFDFGLPAAYSWARRTYSVPRLTCRRPTAELSSRFRNMGQR
jgi:hypothetical protein